MEPYVTHEEAKVQPQRSYLICATPRSGSTLLCEALTNTGLAGRPEEYFEALKDTGLPRRPGEYFTDVEDAELVELLNEYSQNEEGYQVQRDSVSYTEYLERVIAKGTTPNRVFGAKIMWGYLDDFVSNLQTIPQYRQLAAPELFATIFPNLSYVTMTRRDKVRQAISLWRAIQTQAWKEEEDAHPNQKHHHKELFFHFAAIDHLKRQLEEHDAAWQRFFYEHGIEPFAVVYEDLVLEYEATALRILSYLGIAEQPLFAGRRMKQQSDALSEQWVRDYYQVKREKEEVPQ